MKTKLKISKDAEIKKIQDFFDEVKDEPKMVEADVSFLMTLIYFRPRKCVRKR